MMRGATLTYGLVAFAVAGQAAASDILIDRRVAQEGAYAGVRNRTFTLWVRANEAFAGLRGSVTLNGNQDGFSEALVMVGTLKLGEAACRQADGADTAGIPPIARLWAGILKSNDRTPVTIPVAVTLPVPAALPRDGACLATLVSAGYPFLRRDAALYTTTRLRLSVSLRPGGQAVQAFGIGGEFKFPAGGAAPHATYVGLQAIRPLVLDGIAASLSAAFVSGAPQGSGWAAPAVAHWQVGTRFVLIAAPSCRAAHFAGHMAGGDFNILRSAEPILVQQPPGGTDLLSLPLDGQASQAAQASLTATPDQPVHIAPGDCLIAWQSVPGHGAPGSLDVENQSTAYLRAP